MKDKKGFTLIELIAVMGLIAIILLIAAPSLINQIDTSRQNNYDNFVSNLCLASESYINGNDELFPDFKNANDTTTILVGDLISSGYVQSGVINPKTKEKISATDKLTVILTSDKTYSCTLSVD